METVEIDGSFGEGGGQILRTALGLSCVTGKEFRIFNIRKERKKPGLMPQHMTCVNAASGICNARVSGNGTGSTELSFVPGRVRHGSFFFDIKTAGSSSLVFQTVLPPLLFADQPSHVTIRGGTHVPLSPSYHYIAEIFVPMLDRLGVKIGPSISIYGFYPKGGGEVRFNIHPIGKIKGVNAVSKGRLLSIAGYSAVSNLPRHIAERQKSAVMQSLSPLHADIDVIDVPSPGQGTFVFLRGEYENSLTGFSALGARGKPAEEVGREAAALFKDFHDAPICLDPHLADQMVIYLSLSREESTFTTRITQHLVTNLWVIEKFLKMRYQLEGNLNSAGKITLYPS
ncbi:MAG: RNA 3'-phosphate cyclase [Nitrospiraceae bacterium]|nr:MAG: RNA 3'-phosphate cyclase [Nitrospiraceae bacterium]